VLTNEGKPEKLEQPGCSIHGTERRIGGPDIPTSERRSQKQNMQRKFIFTMLVILLLPAVTALNFLIAPDPMVAEEWKGYVPLLIPEDFTLSDKSTEDFFRSLGWKDIITIESQQVKIFNYGDGERSIAYGDVETYLDPLDPRYDPYLKGLGNYFSGSIDGKPARVIYLGHDGNADAALKRTVGDLEERQIDYFIPRLGTGGTLYYRLLLLINIGVFMVMMPRRGRLLFAAGAVGAAFAAAGSASFQFPLFALLTTQIAGWFLCAAWAGAAFTRHFNIGYSHLKRDIRMRLAVYGLFSFAGLMIAVSSGLYQSPIILLVLTLNTALLNAIILYLYFLITQRRVKRQQHTLFFPVPMKLAGGTVIRFMPRWALILLTAVVLPLGVNWLTVDQSAREVLYPQPLTVDTGGGLDWESLKRFSEERRQSVQPTSLETAQIPGGYLPDITDYITHRAFQEGFLYGREYRFPDEGERIVLKVYKRQGLKIFGKDRVFKMFTEEWYEDIISDASKSGVSRLLCAQGGPVQTAYRKNNTFRIPTHTLLGYIIVFLMVCPVVYSIVSKHMSRQSFGFEKHQHKKGQKVA